ncbi:hypothetical protein BJX61DRAFT_544375 [Aspergillus egyptiacus]|nr:hypothetical protein BJX61DRAFT_544375 [Aspergillus egyptiacus]
MVRNSFSSEDRLQRSESSASRSSSSAYTTRRSDSFDSRKSSNERRRYKSNTVYHYGRHSNYWLFGGFSVRDTLAFVNLTPRNQPVDLVFIAV